MRQIISMLLLLTAFQVFSISEESPPTPVVDPTPAPVVDPTPAPTPEPSEDPTPAPAVDPINIPGEMPLQNVKMVRDILTADDVEKLFESKHGTLLPDNTYWAPSKEWVEDALLPEWEKFYDKMNLEYTDHYDCDDFAKMFASFSNWFYAKHRMENKAESLCVAQYFFHKAGPTIDMGNGISIDTTGPGHVIDVIILNDGTKYFIEPQDHGHHIEDMAPSELHPFFVIF